MSDKTMSGSTRNAASAHNKSTRILASAALAALVGIGVSGCTADESQMPAVDPADRVLFTGDREGAVPTSEATTATTVEATPTTFRYGSTTTTTAEPVADETTTTEPSSGSTTTAP